MTVYSVPFRVSDRVSCLLRCLKRRLRLIAREVLVALFSDMGKLLQGHVSDTQPCSTWFLYVLIAIQVAKDLNLYNLMEEIGIELFFSFLLVVSCCFYTLATGSLQFQQPDDSVGFDSAPGPRGHSGEARGVGGATEAGLHWDGVGGAAPAALCG